LTLSTKIEDAVEILKNTNTQKNVKILNVSSKNKTSWGITAHWGLSLRAEYSLA
jgi:hypothetical protein